MIPNASSSFLTVFLCSRWCEVLRRLLYPPSSPGIHCADAEKLQAPCCSSSCSITPDVSPENRSWMGCPLHFCHPDHVRLLASTSLGHQALRSGQLEQVCPKRTPGSSLRGVHGLVWLAVDRSAQTEELLKTVCFENFSQPFGYPKSTEKPAAVPPDSLKL